MISKIRTTTALWALRWLMPFSLFLGHVACEAQVDANKITKESDAQYFVPRIDTSDIDPYFSENNYLITTHGPKSITRNIIEDKSGKYWLATWNGIMSYDGKVFTNHTNQSKLRRYRVFCLLEVRDDIWFGTIGGGLYKYDGKVFSNITSKDGLGSDEIECILKDRGGNIWFGTGAGVSVYNGESFQNYTMEDGLLDTDVHGLVEDKDGKIWVGSTGGVVIYDPASQVSGQEVFMEFKNKEGKSFRNVRHILEDKDGAIWIAGSDGLIHFDGKLFTSITKDFVGYIYEDSKGNILFNKPDKNASSETGLFRYRKGPKPYFVSESNVELVKKEDEMVFGFIDDKAGNVWYGRIGGVTRIDGSNFEYFD